MATIIRINARTVTNGYRGGIHITNNGAVTDVEIDDSSTYEIVKDGVTAPPDKPPVPPVVPEGVLMKKIAFPIGDVNQTAIDVTNITGDQIVAIGFFCHQGAPAGRLRVNIVEIGLGRDKFRHVAINDSPGNIATSFTGASFAKSTNIFVDVEKVRGKQCYINVMSEADGKRSDMRVHLGMFPA